MTAAKTAAPYRSGHCHSGAHGRCVRVYYGCECDCPCHEEPPTVEELEPLVPVLLARHCATCACEGHG